MIADEKNRHFAGRYFKQIDDISESENYFTPVLEEVSKQIEFAKAKVLDVGCGTGLFLKPMINAGCTKCYGVDGPTEFADIAVSRGYREVRVVPDLSQYPIPYENETFDLVVSKDVFEHLLNPIYALSEVRRVIKSGGFLLLHVPNHFSLIKRLKFFFTNDIDTCSFFKGESRWTFPHIRFYEHHDSLQILGKYGFTLVNDLSFYFSSIPIITRFFKLNFLRKYLGKRYPNQFASGFTFLLKKE